MSDEFNQHRQCQTCSVCFLTNDELRDHLDGYRSQERFLSAKLDQSRTHSSALDGKHDTYNAHDYDQSLADGNIHDPTVLGRNDTSADQFRCPYEDCDRDTPFPKRQKLVRHFAKHVRCREVCVYCFEVLTLASQYIAHADTHHDDDGTKNSYTRQICDRLKKNVAESLDSCQLEGVQTRKRTKEEHVSTVGARRVRAKLGVEDVTTSSSPSNFPGFIGTNTLPSGVTPLQPVPAVVQHLNSIGPSARVPVETSDEGYGAPIFWTFTYPSIQAAEQFRGAVDSVQMDILDPSQDLGVVDYNTMPIGAQEGYMFGHLHNGVEDYHGQL